MGTAWCISCACGRKTKAPITVAATFAREAEKAGKRLYVSITEPPLPEEILRGLVSKAQNWKRPDAPYWVIQQINSANNGLTYHAGRLLATYEAGSAHELGLTERLECLGVCDFNSTWSTKDFWLQNFTAHPKVRRLGVQYKGCRRLHRKREKWGSHGR
jgi:carotenoid cleavage dioxygenase-like enzyme